MKTVRFQQIVAASGRPEIYLTWSAPEEDALLMKALKQSRVMTLHQTVRGTAKDYGTIGLQMDAHAQILIFPRSLKKFADRRVVGIDYNAIGQPGRAPASSKPQRSAHGRAKAGRKRSRVVADDSEKLIAFATPPADEKPAKPARPAAPPIAWKEITHRIADAKKAFKTANYADAATVFQKIADALRDH